VTPEPVRGTEFTVEEALRFSRSGIGRRLTLCFVMIVLLMVSGSGLLLWQFHQVRAQMDRLNGVDQELIAVLRFQYNLRSFHEQLKELTLSRDTQRVLRESESLRTTLLVEEERTRAAFAALPAGVTADPKVLATLEAAQSSLPSHVEAINALAASGDWVAVHDRLTNEVQPMELIISELVREVETGVAAERSRDSLEISRAEQRVYFIAMGTGLLTLLMAAALGVVVTRSISEPLKELMAGSKALARGEFQHQIHTRGRDELAHLGNVFNDTAGKLRDLYHTLSSREAYLAEAQRLSHTGSWAWDVDREQTFWSEEIFRIFGYDPAMGPATRELFFRRLHPEDRTTMERVDASISSGHDAEFDYRIILPDGTMKYIHSIGHPVKDARGRVIEFVGTAIDVTEQRHARNELEKAFEEIKALRDQLYKENVALREEIDKVSMFEEIVGSSESLQKVLVQVAKVAPVDTTVLVLGETGTGKELIARAIHKRSKRAGKAFIRVNCAAIPPSLVSSELFGHEKGSFTGAIQRRLGRFESADGGTIFLDEIGDLPAETQVVLLRVLQEREFERVGSNQAIPVDVRILAATNRDLRAAVAAGMFRQDLFYRLNVFPIQIPPLRERADDLPLLVEYLIDRYSKKAGKKIKTIKKSCLEVFQAYDWPGNIRELQNVVERAVLLCEGDVFSVDETWLKQSARQDLRAPTEFPRKLTRLDAEQERQLIEAALAESRGRISGPSGAAAKLGIPRQTLESKMANLGIHRNKYQVG
jgi:PAS domain S-box-containing protein